MHDEITDDEDLLELADPEYIESIKKSREEYKNGDVFTLEDTFKDLLND